MINLKICRKCIHLAHGDIFKSVHGCSVKIYKHLGADHIFGPIPRGCPYRLEHLMSYEKDKAK